MLIVDEIGNCKDATKTAHVGRQYLVNLGKTDNGVVSVSTLWADEGITYPLDLDPYTPAHWFARGTADPAFRTKPQIALDLVKRAVGDTWPFRAIVANSLHCENETFRTGLDTLMVGYVLALRPSHCWWHVEGQLGSLAEAVEATIQEGPEQPGAWGEGRAELSGWACGSLVGLGAGGRTVRV
ncbi:MAG: hypothetical protein NVS2B7_37360 [Herpetosiphon sp.]